MEPTLIWALAAALYGGFLLWYRGLRRRLTPDEVERFLDVMRREGASEEDLVERRRFLENDDGGDFVMVNVIELRDRPTGVGDVKPGESSQQVMSRYMAYMWPQLLRRACHPVLGGSAAAVALDVWGIEKAERWSQAGLMRYRSRRDLLEIAGNPEFAASHPYKIAAMNKTIAFPISPYVILGGARLVVGLALLAITALLHLAIS